MAVLKALKAPLNLESSSRKSQGPARCLLLAFNLRNPDRKNHRQVKDSL
jgi:hypothetical protein